MTFGKIHDSIFDSSIMEEDLETRYIFFCFITIADKHGVVDATISALSRKFNIPHTNLLKAIKCLSKPDLSSRTPDNEGRRIEPIRDSFGWRIINYEHYRNIRTYNDRQEYLQNYMKNYMRNERKLKGKEVVKPDVKHVKPGYTNTDTDTDTDTDKRILSQLLLDLILKRRPNFKKPDIIKWAKHIDLMIRVDKRDPEEIKTVIEWCQQDTFWKNNILSTTKLREKYDQLALKAGKKQNNEGQGTPMVCEQCGDSGQYAGIDESGLCTNCRIKIV